MVGFNTI